MLKRKKNKMQEVEAETLSVDAMVNPAQAELSIDTEISVETPAPEIEAGAVEETAAETLAGAESVVETVAPSVARDPNAPAEDVLLEIRNLKKNFVVGTNLFLM